MQNFINMDAINIKDTLGATFEAAKENVAERGKEFAKVFDEVKDTIKEKVSKDTKSQETQNQKEDKSNQHTNDTQTNKQSEPEQNIKTEGTTIDKIEVQKPKEELKKVTTGENTTVLSADEVIQDAIQKLNDVIENAKDGQLSQEDVAQIKAVLAEINQQINSNQMVVSEDTKQLINELSQRLLTQNPQDLEVASLEKDLRQLQKDIEASAFKTQAQLEEEEKNNNPNKALEMNVNTEDNNKFQVKTQKTTKEDGAVLQKTDNKNLVQVSDTVEEGQNTQKTSNNQEIDQKMLDEMQVRIEDTQNTNTNTNSQNQNYSNAQDEVIKLQIQGVQDEGARTTFAFDKTIQTVQNTNTQNVQTAPKELNINDILNQLSSKFEQLKDGQSTKITMTLRPNDLGRITIELIQSQNGISTNIIAQNSQVKELLDKNIDALKHQLASQGVNVQNVQIKTVEQNSQANLNNNFNGEKDNQNQNGNNNQNQGSARERQEGERHQNFKFNRGNIIENIDFENNAEQNTTSINTLRGKISYNL